MFRSKFVSILLILTIVTVLVAGCGGGENTTTGNKEGEVIVLKWAHVAAISNDKHTDSAKIIAEEIAVKTNGRLKIELYPASQLGDEREILEGVKLGTIEMASLSSGALPGIFPEIQVTSAPFMFPSREVAYKFFDGPMGDKLANIMLEKNGIRILSWGENGLRCFSNKVRPIEKPEDMKGLKIRTMENPAHIKMVECLGGSASPIPFSEVYTALAQGTVDGQENPPSLTQSMKFYEQLKYMTLDYHIFDPLALMINEDVFNSLPEDLQKILQEEAFAWKDLERKMSKEQDERDLKFMAEQGLEIIELSPEQIEPFREATQPVYDMIAEEVGRELLEEALNYVKNYMK